MLSGFILSLMKTVLDAARAANRVVLTGLRQAAEYTDNYNPYGEKSLVLDVRAEEEIIRVLMESGTSFAIMSEERGVVMPEERPEYLAVIDPVDGSANLERGIPLCSVGISVVPYSQVMTTDDVILSVVRSFFTRETYVAVRDRGVIRNGRSVTVSQSRPARLAVISYDTKREWDPAFSDHSVNTIRGVRDIRRTGSNLLDLCWTACGALDAMVDLRGILPIIHLCGTHMVQEAGGCVLDGSGRPLLLPLELSQKMSFVAASSENLAREILDLFNRSTGPYI